MTEERDIPSPRELWKAPVREWVRDLWRKRHAKMPPGRGERCTLGRSAPRERDPVRGRWEAEAEEENARLIGRQEELRLAADYVAAAFAEKEEVQRVVLFGSVASPLRKELPRFRRFRRVGVALWHECKDVDVAVWLSDRSALHALTQARGRAVNALFADTGMGVAHH